MAGQLKATQLFQLAKFLFHCFDTDRTGIGAKVVQQHSPAIRLGSKQERVHSLLHGSGQTIHQSTAEVFFEACNGGTYKPFHAVRGKGLNAELAASCGHGVLQPVEIALACKQVLTHPPEQNFRISSRRLTESQSAADLSAVVLEGPAFPAVLLPCRGWNAHLLSQKLDCRLR
jgi:hypothetical protein